MEQVTPGGRLTMSFPRDSVGNLLLHIKVRVVSTANSGPNTNGSQFFNTHKPTPYTENIQFLEM